MKRLGCAVGVHAWTRRVERGESYKVCSACGRTPRTGAYAPRAHGESMSGGFGFKLVALAIVAGLLVLGFIFIRIAVNGA